MTIDLPVTERSAAFYRECFLWQFQYARDNPTHQQWFEAAQLARQWEAAMAAEEKSK